MKALNPFSLLRVHHTCYQILTPYSKYQATLLHSHMKISPNPIFAVTQHPGRTEPEASTAKILCLSQSKAH